jgi:ribosomal protein S27AE
MIGPDIPIISVHQIPTYEEVLQFAYQIYQKAKDQDQTLNDCQSIIQQIKQNNDILSAENTVWHESFYEMQDSHTDLENKRIELDQAVKDRDETISQLRNENQRLRDKIRSYTNGENNGRDTQRPANPTTRTDSTTPGADHSETTELHPTAEKELRNSRTGPSMAERGPQEEGQDHSRAVRAVSEDVSRSTEAARETCTDGADYQHTEKSPTEDTRGLCTIDHITELKETISNQEQIIQRNNKEHQAETNRLEARIQADWQWRERERRLFANPDLDPSDKLLLWADLDFIETSKMSPTEPTVLWIEGISQSIGLSTTTIHTHHQTLQKKCHCLTIHSEKKLEDKAKGDIRTYTTLTLDKIVSTNPEDIHKDGGKKWGGARKKNCPKCGSENVDQFSVLYCRDCQKAAWYGTAGLRKDADMMAATEAIVREYQEQQSSNPHEREETRTKQVAFSPVEPKTRTKQVAFASQEDKEPIILDNRCKNQSDQAETHAVETPNLVAVAVENQENELEVAGYVLPTASSSSCMKNPATCTCCESIDMDYAPIHRCYNCGTSNYEWNHMRRRWLCGWCGATPAF